MPTVGPASTGKNNGTKTERRPGEPSSAVNDPEEQQHDDEEPRSPNIALHPTRARAIVRAHG